MKRYIAIAVTIAVVAVMIMPVVSAQAASQSSGTRTPIKHVINIFLENHSFDNLFGIYPYDRYSTNSSLSANLSTPLNLLGNRTLLSRLNEIPAGVFTTKDPNEGYVQYHIDWNHGKMNGFLNGSGPQSLTYYTAAQMAPEWDFAEQYGIADNYYAPQISESSPNHLYYLAGYSPVFNDYGPPPYVPISQSIFGELSAYNVSWDFYINNTHEQFPDWEYLYGHGAYSSHLQSWNRFLNESANGTLPSVSYLFSQGTGDTQGPPDNMLNGEEWLLYVVDSIENSPLWNSTAIFITYDEFGGYYDQVSPPVLDGVQLGFRIPLIVISPFAKEDYISSTEMTHTSLLAFIDYNWNMPALNQLVSVSNIPIDFFYFEKGTSGEYITRNPVQFNATSGFPVPESIHFNPVTSTSGFNFSRIFPMTPQIAFGNLPYAKNGSSHLNLSSIGAGIYNKENYGFTPFDESSLYFSLLAVLEIALGGLSVYVFRRRGKNAR